MQIISETRLQRLALLVKRHGGTLAELNIRLGLDRTDPTLSQIRSRVKHSKTGKPRVMGDELARRIEVALDLAIGWMDTPLTITELCDESDLRVRAITLINSMPLDQVSLAVDLIEVLTKHGIQE